MGLPAAFFLAKNAVPMRRERVAWLTAFGPITVAGPRPIHTAFPASLACKLMYECKVPVARVSIGGGFAMWCVPLAIFPIGLAFFDQRAQAFLGIFETI
jgi:hypothetical protein